MGPFQPQVEHLNVKIKAVRYSALQKAQTLIASILLGCPRTSSINHRLVPDRVPCSAVRHGAFTDQSQVNFFLNRMTEESLVQLGQAHHELLASHS